MKKFVNLVTVIIIFATVFTSCEKMEINHEPTEQTVSDPVLTKILNFKKKIENPDNIKSDEMMSIDSAVWYIEALLNYEYCVIQDSLEVYTETSIDSFFLDIPNTAGRVSFFDVSNAYLNIENSILAGLKKLQTANKRIDVIDVSFKNSKLATYFVYNYETNNKRGGFNPPDTHIDGDWHWGGISDEETGDIIPLGMCDYTYYGHRDATTEISRVLHYVEPAPVGVYFTDVTDFRIAYNPGNPYWDLFVRNDNPYPIWTCDEGGNPAMNHSDFWFGACDQYPSYIYPCIEEEELNWYKEATRHAINQIKNNIIPDGYTYKDFYLVGWTGHNPPPASQTYYFHSLFVYYGIAHHNIIR